MAQSNDDLGGLLNTSTFIMNGHLEALTEENFRHVVEHSGRITPDVLRTTVSTLSVLALVSFFLRLSIRWYTLRKLKIDDGFLCLAVGCLATCAAIIDRYWLVLYLESASQRNPGLQEAASLLGHADTSGKYVTIRNVLAVFSWTTIYAVKLCFLTFMWQLIDRCPRLQKSWWACVSVTVVLWFFAAFKAFLLPAETSVGKNLAFTIAMAIADIATDLMIVSFPVILLWGLKIKTSTKLSIAAFLGLSAFMVVCSLARIAGFMGEDGKTPDATWRMLWTQVECCVAVIMASLTAVRSLFAARKGESLTSDPPTSDPPASASPEKNLAIYTAVE